MVETTGDSSTNTDDDNVYEPAVLVAHIGDEEGHVNAVKNDDDRSTVCSGGNGDGESSCTIPSSHQTMQPLETPENGDSMPSVERRRRRRNANNNNNMNYNNDQFDIDYNDYYRPITSQTGWRGDSLTMMKYETAILGLLVVVAIRLLVLREKIMHDIRRTRHEALDNDRRIFLPRYLRQIPYILSVVFKHLLNGDILYFTKRLITNPLQSPQILYELLVSIWVILCDLLWQLQEFLRSLPILHQLFGMGVTISGSTLTLDAIPELEEKAINNNDEHSENDNVEGKAANGHNAAIKETTKARTKPSSVGRVVRHDINDLPPAFENEEDYPVGWLMYHPKHGVRTREYLMEFEGNGNTT